MMLNIIRENLKKVVNNMYGCPKDFGLVNVGCRVKNKVPNMSCNECWTKAIMEEEE